jgi:hypothetical protein
VAVRAIGNRGETLGVLRIHEGSTCGRVSR